MNSKANSISTDCAYTQALSDLIAVKVVGSRIEEFTAGFEENPAFAASQEATRAGWKAVAAAVEAGAAR